MFPRAEMRQEDALLRDTRAINDKVHLLARLWTSLIEVKADDADLDGRHGTQLERIEEHRAKPVQHWPSTSRQGRQARLVRRAKRSASATPAASFSRPTAVATAPWPFRKKMLNFQTPTRANQHETRIVRVSTGKLSEGSSVHF
jgi:hypothetical protein